MSEFSKEEVELCRKIAKKEEKNIKKGDWYFDNNINKPLLWSAYSNLDLIPKSQKKVDVIPLWTLSDCLEWLKSNIDRFQFSLNHFRTQGYCIQLWKGKETQAFYSDYSTEIKPKNKTLLEALLRAILAILEEQE